MKKLLFAAAMLLGLASCSKESDEAVGGKPQKDILVSFNVELPGGGDVVYPKSRAEGDMVHDLSEFDISNIDLYEFAVGEGGSPAITLLAKHTFTKDAGLTSLGAGHYSLTLKIPYAHYMERRKFIFVANDLLENATLTYPQNGAAGMSYDEFARTMASISLATGDDASKLAPKDGIAMSGVGKVNNDEIITLKTAFNCEVHLKRIVARVDVINNTPNMVITDVRLLKATSQAYIMEQATTQIPASADNLDLKYNPQTENGNAAEDAKHGLSDNYQDQHNGGAGLKKVFYMYERENNEGNYSSVEISYTLNGTTQGQIVVPFRKRDAGQAWVNIQRNHLYKITLGNGKDVVTDRVEISLVDEDWNVVDVDHDVDVEQDKMNAALMVNMFMAYNVASVDDWASGAVTFETTLNNEVHGTDKESIKKQFVTFTELVQHGYAGNNNTKLFTNNGKQYRLPTSGEIGLLLPYAPDGIKEGKYTMLTCPVWGEDNLVPWSENLIYKMVTTPFEETLYLTNTSAGTQDQTANTEGKEDKIIKGRSQLKQATTGEKIINYPSPNWKINTIYGLRFYGSQQHAAYRWEYCTNDDPAQQYLSIKIKALKQYDALTTIDQVSEEKYWESGFIEFKLPLSGRFGYKTTEEQLTTSIEYTNYAGYMWASTKLGNNEGHFLSGQYARAKCGSLNPGYRFPLRLVKVSK